MAKRTVTSRHVAQLAGVSQTTVSFVLNDVEAGNISAATRQRVLEAARQLGYVPDAAARSLARGRSSNIGLILVKPHAQVFIDDFVPNIISGLSLVTQQRGFRILVELAGGAERPDPYTDLIKGKEVAGMIVMLDDFNAEDVQVMRALAQEGFPLVSLRHLGPDIYSVSEDHLDGVRQAVAHLAGLGHQRIACITFAPATNPTVRERLAVYRETLESLGIPYDPAMIRFGVFDPETGYEAMQSLLQAGTPPTALFAMNDVMAFGAMTAIHESGLRIPDDIAIASYNDWRLARFTTPPLTSVRAPDIEQGRRAGEMLMDLIEGRPPATPQVRLPTTLIVRESCGAHLRREPLRRTPRGSRAPVRRRRSAPDAAEGRDVPQRD